MDGHFESSSVWVDMARDGGIPDLCTSILAKTEDIQIHFAPSRTDSLRERAGLLRTILTRDSGEGGEGPELPLDEVDPKVRHTVERAGRLAAFLDWLNSVEPTDDFPFESDLFPSASEEGRT